MVANESERRPEVTADAGPAASVEPTAAELFDPAAFARRVAEARERRMDVLARRAALPGTDLPPKPSRIPPAGARGPVSAAPETPAVSGAVARGTRTLFARLLASLRRRPFAVFGLGGVFGAGFGAAALLSAQLLAPASIPAPAGLTTIAALPTLPAAVPPALPGRQAPAIRAALPDAAPDPLRIAAMLPGGGRAASPPPRPVDLVLLAPEPRRAGSGGQARRAGAPPGLPRLLDRLTDDAARAAATLVRDLQRIPRELARSDDRRAPTRSSRGPRRN